MFWFLVVILLIVLVDHVCRVLVREWYTYVWWNDKPGYKKCGARLHLASHLLGGIASIILEAVDPIEVDERYYGR